MPSLTLLALDLFPHNRGLASSLLGFQHSLFSAIVAGVVSPLIAHRSQTLAAGMAVLATAGVLSWVAYLSQQGRARTKATEAGRLA
jgi:DHA1 family bicyclomycin/chloramphenicol resistance-like MFS transporter